MLQAFFKTQMDYFFFAYGFSFLLLSVVALAIGRDKKSGFSWRLLGLFGLFHGLNEWLDGAALSLNDPSYLGALRLAILLISFILLTEFARRGLSVLRGREISRFLTVGLLASAAIGGLFGASGLNATIRYSFGFVGSGAAAWAVYLFYTREKKRSRPLLLVVAALAFYAVAAGIFVPRVPFPLACWISADAFSEATDVPIQVVRTACAFLMALGLWLFYAYLPLQGERPGLKRSVKPTSALMVLVVFVIVVAGWFYAEKIGRDDENEIRMVSAGRAGIYISYIESIFDKARSGVHSLGGALAVVRYVSDGDPLMLPQVNEVLDRYQACFSFSACYLIDAKGVCVASSNRASPESFVGKDYSFRPYFKEALAGKASDYLAFGWTSRENGFYSSVPVKDASGNVALVMVVKTLIRPVSEQSVLTQHTFLIDPHGVIFLDIVGGRFENSLLWPVSEKVKQSLRESRQFGELTFKPLLRAEGEVIDGDHVEWGRMRSLVTRKDISVRGWTLVTLSPLGLVGAHRLLAMLSILLSTLPFLLFFLILRRREEMLIDITKSHLRLDAIMKSPADIAIVATDEKGLITVFSAGAERLLGYRAGDVVDRLTYEAFFSKDEIISRSRILSDRLKQPVDAGNLLEQYEHLKPNIEQEWMLVRKDGTVFPVRLSVTRKRSSDGLVIGYVMIAVDSTDVKRSERESAETAKFLQTMIDAIPSPVYYKDTAGVYLGCNESFVKYVGYSRDRIVGKTIFEIAPRDLATVYSEMDKHLLRQRGVHTHEGFVQNALGARRSVIFNKAVFFNRDGTVAGLIGSIFDITERKKIEESLRDSEVRYRSLVEHIRAITYIVSLDDKSTTIFMSPQVKGVVGYATDEYLRDPDIRMKLIHPADRGRVAAEIARANRESAAFSSEYRMVKRDGTVAWFRDEAEVVRDRLAKPLYRQGVIYDITERKVAEQKIAESERRFREILENISLFAVTLDVEGRILFCNDHLLAVTGWPREEVIGKAWFDQFIPQEVRPALVSRFVKRVRGELGEDAVKTRTEVPLLVRSGLPRQVSWTHTLLKNEAGEVSGVTSIGADVTEEKRVGEALRASREYLERIINTVADPIFVKDGEHRFVLVNDAMIAFGGWTGKEVLGKDERDFFPKEEIEVFWQKDDEVLKTGRESVNEESFTTSEGKRRTIVTKKARYVDPSGGVFIVGVIRDITERKGDEEKLTAAYRDLKAAQQALIQTEKFASLGRFASGVAHEIRNPLAIILSATEYLDFNLKGVPEETREITGKIKEATERADAVVKRLFEFTRPQGLPRERCLASAVLSAATDILNYRAPLLNIAIETVIDSDPQIQIERSQLEQALFNLLTNAIDAMPNGGKILVRSASNADVAVITVTDTGEGIAPADLEMVFEPFFTTKRDQRCIGLGLATAKMIIENHRGSITIESVKGKGTTVTLMLPIAT